MLLHVASVFTPGPDASISVVRAAVDVNGGAEVGRGEGSPGGSPGGRRIRTAAGPNLVGGWVSVCVISEGLLRVGTQSPVLWS